MSPEKMPRVTKNETCPVCGKRDWCLVAEDGTAAICQRIQEGSKKRCGDAGWLHILVNKPKNQQHHPQHSFTVVQNDSKPVKDFVTLQQQYNHQIDDERLNSLSQQLGVSVESLKRLGIGWDGKAYTSPMSNDFGKITGIRRRFVNGAKYSLKGSKTGLFIPADLPSEGPLLICEGPSDTAAALDLGFAAIGRPNCNSCVDMTVKVCKGHSEISIIGDNDPPKEDGKSPGQDGAEKLAGKLLPYCPNLKIVYPPDGTKDLRQWLQAGLNSDQLQQIIKNTKPLTMELR